MLHVISSQNQVEMGQEVVTAEEVIEHEEAAGLGARAANRKIRAIRQL